MQRHGMALWITLAAWPAAAQSTQKPPVPPAAPTRGFTIAVLVDGLDYTKPTIAARMARDGEGVAITYDAADDDTRPFAAQASTDALLATSPALLIPIRVAPNAEAWTRAFAFLRRSPARVAVLLLPPPEGMLAREAMASSDKLLIVPATALPKANAPNVMTVAALPAAGSAPVAVTAADLVLAPPAATREAPAGGAAAPGPQSSVEAALLASGLFSCTDLSKARSPADVVTALVAKGSKGPAGSAPLIELCSRR